MLCSNSEVVGWVKAILVLSRVNNGVLTQSRSARAQARRDLVDKGNRVYISMRCPNTEGCR